MNYMFEAGFLGTRAPFFMDFVMIMVALLPLLVGMAIAFAKKRNYHAHAFTQQIIFVVAVIVVGYFEYGVRVGGGYEGFVKGSSISHDYAFYVLILHIFIAVVGFGIWLSTIVSARKDSKNNLLPGKGSLAHKKAGKRAFWAINLTSLSGIWV
jgi:putative membrane protein